jgi:protein involved in polysaccharide export with SLBB domain
MAPYSLKGYFMLNWKKLVFFISLLLYIGGNFSIYTCNAETARETLRFAQIEYKSYKRIFPGSISPKPDEIQVRDSREEMKADAKRESELLQAEKKVSEGRPTRVVGDPTKIYYKISVDDRLFIAVWRVPDLSLEHIVGPDGYISFPLIGDMQAADRTLSELDDEITEKLKKYIHDPQVSVVVRAFAGDQVTIIGEVKNPGIYKFTGKTRIMNILALANGFTDRAKIVSVVIVREPKYPEEKVKLIVVNAKRILKGGLKDNINVEANDIIYVSRTFVSNVKEFYDKWIVPSIDTALDYESYKTIRRGRQ